MTDATPAQSARSGVTERAARLGIDAEYTDARGQRQVVPHKTVQRLVGALEDAAKPPGNVLPTFVLRPSDEPYLPIPEEGRFTWQLAQGGSQIAAGTGLAGALELPPDLPLGIYELAIAPEAAGRPPLRGIVIRAPQSAYQMDDVAAERVWVLAVQLYAVRSHRNWGHGDFTDLRDLVRIAADVGAAGIGLNPLHALFDDRPEQASPYSPNSRLFLNTLYIDPEAIPEFPGLEASGIALHLESLRRAEQVDYAGVGAAKAEALRLAYEGFARGAEKARRAEFERFRAERGAALARFAAFEVLRRRFLQVWWEWPEEWRDPDAQKIEQLRAEAPAEMEFYEFTQWVADSQLAACQAEARKLGLAVGLYIDLAVGVEPGGADAWSAQESVVQQVEVGAPPDLLNTAGQAWGLAAFNPRALEAQAFAPFTELLGAAMRHAGAIRLDHVLGLNRLYLIPFGLKPNEGAYVRYPLQALLAVVALQSVRHRCLVIGEDLGTVPEELRGILADWGIWSYLVMLFERRDSGEFKLPGEYRRNALVTFSTHDLPTFSGWRSAHDLRVKRGLGLDPGETDEERETARVEMREALGQSGLSRRWNLELVEILRFLARSPSRLMVVAIEDVLGLADQPNVPGTVLEHPNWRRRLPVAIDDLRSQESLRSAALALAEEGRSQGAVRL